MKLVLVVFLATLTLPAFAAPQKPEKKKIVPKKELKARPKRPAKSFKEEHKHWVEERSNNKKHQ